MPSVSENTRILLWGIAAIAGVLSAVIGNELAKNIVYFISRRGRPPTRRPIPVWVIFLMATTVSISLGALAAYAPAKTETNLTTLTVSPVTGNDDVNYVGRVIDAETQKPIEGAKVTLDWQGVPPIVFTDSEGIYRFILPIEDAINGRIRVDADGYETYTRNIVFSTQPSQIEDIRLIPFEAPKATIVASSFVGYNFESGTQGWNTSEGSYKRAILSTSSLLAYAGEQSLVLDTELYGSGSLEFKNHNQADVYRHTESLVYFNQIPDGIDFPGPFDLTGKRLSCFVYLPAGLAVIDNSPPAYVRLILKDRNFENQFSEPIIITKDKTEQWLELIYVATPDESTNFDATQVNAMGIRLDSLDDSTVNYNGPIFIDYCAIGLND